MLKIIARVAIRFKNKIKKEVIQPQVPLRLPCDDLAHLTEPRFATAKRLRLI